ncbi:sensor histidine kinase [Longivirga aurantiaca]|uniref:histidine kinase n=1 Tax=Longivirga aurantiaca TaxID=1837743 RepID=A0ABW1SVF5_9ACTN
MSRGGHRRVLVQDVVLAGAFTLAAQLELTAQSSVVEGPLLWQRSAFLLITSSLAARRRAPITAVAVASTGFALQAAVGDAPVASGFLALLVLLASLGFYASPGRGASGVALLLAAGAVPAVLSGMAVGDLLVNAVVIIGTWAGAFLIHRSIERRLEAELGRERAAREAVLSERARIARDLHDSVAHAITVMTLQAGGARRRSSDPVVQDALLVVEGAGRQALTDMNRFLEVLGSDVEALGEAPGLDDVPDIVDVTRAAGADVEVSISGQVDRVPASVGATGYRVVQEALTNALKHASPGPMRVRVVAGSDALDVLVVSPAALAGPRAGANGGGRGLRGLRGRVAVFGGSLAAGAEGDVWQVAARIPYEDMPS